MLNTLFPENPQGHLACRLNTLAAMISGIVGSRSVSLPAIASKVPGGGGYQNAKVERRVKRFERWLRNKAVESEIFFLPFAEALFLSLCHGPLVLVIDGSIVGRGCMTLMVGVVYKQRALPVAWIVARRRKGHFPERVHLELMGKVQRLIPDGARESWCSATASSMASIFKPLLDPPPNPGGLVQLQDKIVDRFALTIYPYSLESPDGSTLCGRARPRH